MTFLNVVEIESALSGLAAAYPNTSRLITLPNATAEGRTSHALMIGTAGGARGRACCSSAERTPGSGAVRTS